MLGLGSWLGAGLGVWLEDEPLELEVVPLLDESVPDVLPLLDVLPVLGAVAVPDVPVAPVVLGAGEGLEDAFALGADFDGASRAVADDNGVPSFAAIRSGEGVADPVAGVDAAVVVGAVGAVVAEDGDAAEDCVDVEPLAGSEGPEESEDFADVGVAGSSAGARSLGEVVVATGVVEADVRRVGALVVELSEAASGPSSTKPPAVRATATAPPAASAWPTRAGRM